MIRYEPANRPDLDTFQNVAKQEPHVPPSNPVSSMRQRQRRISRSNRGVRVSRCIPLRDVRMMRTVRDVLHSSLTIVSEESVHVKKDFSIESKKGLGKRSSHVHAVTGIDISPKGQLQSAVPRKLYSHRDDPPTCDPAQTRPNVKNRLGLSDTAAWTAIQRTIAQQDRLSSIVPHELSPGKAGRIHRPSVPSRSSSRRKALNHFTKELKKYSRVAGANGRLPVITPTESEEIASLHTVKPLVPYMHEFEVAGLAITSSQQRQCSPQLRDKQHSFGKCTSADCHFILNSHARN
jgi:hypothetical protein